MHFLRGSVKPSMYKTEKTKKGENSYFATQGILHFNFQNIDFSHGV